MKKCAVAVLLLTLAIAPAAFGCDPHPGGLTGALTVNVRSCSTTNYTAKDMVAACSDLRTLIAPYLTSKTSQGTTFTYTNDLNDANFIIDVYTTSADPNKDDEIRIIQVVCVGECRALARFRGQIRRD